jgi:hypothetical protein
MRLLLSIVVALPCVSAAACPMAHMHNIARQLPNLPLSQNEGNSGPIDSTTFSASEQFVNVQAGSGHEYQDPGTNDKRGPCPGLNAAANHNFLPRSGVATIQQSKFTRDPEG